MFLIKEGMIVSSNAKISRTFLCDELVQPYATDPSTCMYQDSPSRCSCQIRTCMSQYDSMQLMDHRLSLLELSPSEFHSPMTRKLKSAKIDRRMEKRGNAKPANDNHPPCSIIALR